MDGGWGALYLDRLQVSRDERQVVRVFRGAAIFGACSKRFGVVNGEASPVGVLRDFSGLCRQMRRAVSKEVEIVSIGNVRDLIFKLVRIWLLAQYSWCVPFSTNSQPSEEWLQVQDE